MGQLKNPTALDIPKATPRLDLSSTATAMLFDEKVIFDSPLSPLIQQLDDVFNMSIPEVPAFENNSLPDHISLEKTVDGIMNEHNYFSTYNPADLEPGHSKLWPSPPPIMFPGLDKPVHKKSKGESGKKRKRNHSSSSSSSSSSCASCGTNCSCSSGSSSSSSSSNDSSDSSDSDSNSDSEHSKAYLNNPTAKVQKPLPIKPKPFPQKRGRKPKPKVDEPPKVKKPKGRPPKGSKRGRGSSSSHTPLKSGNGLGNCEAEILKYFENPMDAFIMEEDLDTTDSDSDEIFHKKQLTESIISVPPHIDEPWTAGNEKFLLKEVKGVNDLEELRPKPEAIKAKNSSSLKLGGGSPIKRLIVRRNFGNAGNVAATDINSEVIVIGNTEITGKGNLLTSLSTTTNNSTITITRAPVTAATATPASAFVKGKKKMMATGVTYSPNAKPSLLPSQPNTPPSPSVSRTSSFAGNQISSDTLSSTPPKPVETSTGSVEPNLFTPPGPPPAEKPRRARMKVTEIKGKVAPPVPVPTEVVAEQVEEKLYCICQGPHDNVSQMIGCDAKDCPYQWFHFECVGIVVAPKGKWFCADCKDRQRAKPSPSRGKKSHEGSPAGNTILPASKGGVGGGAGRPRGYTNIAFIGHTVS